MKFRRYITGILQEVGFTTAEIEPLLHDAEKHMSISAITKTTMDCSLDELTRDCILLACGMIAGSIAKMYGGLKLIDSGFIDHVYMRVKERW